MAASALHILWDWNGTLLNDTPAAFAAFNRLLASRGLETLTLERYRAEFSFPVRPWYERLGFDLAHEDWDALAAEYHALYLSIPSALADDAREAVELAAAKGAVQSVVSALRQDLLERAVAASGLRERMSEVCGSNNLDGASKAVWTRALVGRQRSAAALRGEPPPRFVLIGDALHDAEVAASLGMPYVLYGGGSHSPARLRLAGPVADTLCDCVRRVDEMVGF